jgi:hypothetical protein
VDLYTHSPTRLYCVLLNYLSTRAHFLLLQYFILCRGHHKETKNAVSWDVTRMALVTTDISEEYIASIIKVKRVNDLVLLTKFLAR